MSNSSIWVVFYGKILCHWFSVFYFKVTHDGTILKHHWNILQSIFLYYIPSRCGLEKFLTHLVFNSFLLYKYILYSMLILDYLCEVFMPTLESLEDPIKETFVNPQRISRRGHVYAALLENTSLLFW